MASNEEGDTNTQPSNSNTSYSPSPPHSPRVYVYDDDNNLYYGYYHRSPVNYPPTPTHNYMHEDTTTTLPPTPPYDDTLPHSPSSHNPMSFLFSHPPFRYNNATAPSYLPSSPGNNSSSSQYYAPYKSARYLVYGYGHTEQDSATVFVNNDNDTEGDNEGVDGFSPYGHNEGDSGAVLVNNDNEATVNTSCGKSFEAFCPPHASVFDCNICMEMAKEPVVTSCGHLYCWPCLYNWLHYHSKDSKCPACKGEVNESMITPIYGQGSYNDGNSTISVPPRPCGRRFETTNQW